MRPSKMMQQIAGFYRREYPQHFRQEPSKDVLEVQLPDTLPLMTSICSQTCSQPHVCRVCIACINCHVSMVTSLIGSVLTATESDHPGRLHPSILCHAGALHSPVLQLAADPEPGAGAAAVQRLEANQWRLQARALPGHRVQGRRVRGEPGDAAGCPHPGEALMLHPHHVDVG
jgi:hypothetical protein